MGRLLIGSLCASLLAGSGWAQDERAGDNFRTYHRAVFADVNKLLATGSQALGRGEYDEGIRLTELGLEQSGNSAYLRTTALSNLCAAYAIKKQADAAIEYCSQSLEIDAKNWRAFNNRAYAHWLKGMHTQAASDLDAAAAINPSASEIAQIRGLINQSTLEPRVRMEDHQ